jgi:hypothetical protein
VWAWLGHVRLTCHCFDIGADHAASPYDVEMAEEYQRPAGGVTIPDNWAELSDTDRDLVASELLKTLAKAVHTNHDDHNEEPN